MPVLQGTTSGSIIGVAYNVPSTIKSISLTNNTGGAATVTAYIIEEGTNNKIKILNLSIAANETYLTDVPIKVASGFTFYLVTNVSLDYYVSIK